MVFSLFMCIAQVEFTEEKIHVLIFEKLGMVAHACNTKTWEAEAEWLSWF